MKGKWLALGVLVIIAVWLSLSCGRSQELVSIAIQPSVETFGSTTTPVIYNAGAQVQLRALGSYVHPPVIKDITNQVTWASNTPAMFTVNSAGLLTATGLACGGTLISATSTTNTSVGGISSSGAIVTGYMTGNVVCFTGTGGGSGNPLLSVTFVGNGVGTVADSALSFSCSSPGPCSTQAFTSGTVITLTATPTGTSTFGGWSSCPVSSSTNICSFTLVGNTVVTPTFN